MSAALAKILLSINVGKVLINAQVKLDMVITATLLTLLVVVNPVIESDDVINVGLLNGHAKCYSFFPFVALLFSQTFPAFTFLLHSESCSSTNPSMPLLLKDNSGAK